MDVIYQFIGCIKDKTLAIFLTTLAAIYAIFLRNIFPKIKFPVLHTVLIAASTFSFDLLAFSTVFDPSEKISSILFNWKDYFASWCKIYIKTCSLTYSILTLLEILEEVSNTPALQTEMTDDTKSFLQSFSKSNGFDLSIIMGFFIGRNFIIKHCIITHDSKNNVSTEHCWLLLPDIGLEIDPLYKNFKKDEYKDCIFFNQNHHPLQTKESFTSKSVENIVTREIAYNSIAYNDAFKASFKQLQKVINKKIEEKAKTLGVVTQYFSHT